MADRVLAQYSPYFDRMYTNGGRASIPPEELLKSCLPLTSFGSLGATTHTGPPRTRRLGWLGKVKMPGFASVLKL